MIYKVAGYELSFDQVRDWVRCFKPEKADLEDMDLPFVIEDMLKEKGVSHWVWIIVATDPDPASNRSFVLLVRKGDYDSTSTMQSWSEYEEDEKDRRVKELIVSQTGLMDAQVKWVTVPDPFFKDPNRPEHRIWAESESSAA